MSDLPPDEEHTVPTEGKAPQDGVTDEQREAGAELILAAFRRAYESGRSGWYRMSTAVLKNRILDLTNRDFDESAWGADTILDFVKQYGDLVSVDLTQRPPLVELKDRAAAAATAQSTIDDPEKRIRRDLWEAVLDFSNTEVAYVFQDGRAVPVPKGEADEPNVLPTITGEEFDRWRSQFVENIELVVTDPDERELLHRWRDQRRPDALLPRTIRRKWNANLKQHVWNQLNGWFSERDEDLPEDALVAKTGPQAHARRPSERPATADEDLRSLVQDVVEHMTREELEELRLPPTALLRARGR